VESVSPRHSLHNIDTSALGLAAETPVPPPLEPTELEASPVLVAPSTPKATGGEQEVTSDGEPTSPTSAAAGGRMSAEQKRNLLKRQSQYLVKQEKQQFLRYRIEIVCKEGVISCEPNLPNPPVFQHGPLLKEFLLTKCAYPLITLRAHPVFD
jgi:hypothetical protein